MRIRTFKARTMPEAIALVRAELGDDAIIISTDVGKRGVELRAAAERATRSGTFNLDEGEDEFETVLLKRLALGNPEPVEIDARFIAERLLYHRVPAQLAQELAETAATQEADSNITALARVFDERFTFNPLPVAPRRNLILVGLPGAGKTATAAKLAARALLGNEQAVLVTADTHRSGGVAQLESFATLLKIKVHIVDGHDALRTAMGHITRQSPNAVVIVDTPGTNPFDEVEMGELLKLAKAISAEPVLVTPAGLDPNDTAEISKIFAQLGAKRLIATRVDAARRFGGLLLAAHHAGLAFAHISQTPYVAEGLEPLTGLKLARLFIGAQTKSGGSL
jgi:flagellar biosynthesis protein FlhF